MVAGNPTVSASRNRTCPVCQDYALRVRRRLIDRILHPFVQVRRYRCMSTACNWEGVMKPGQRSVGADSSRSNEPNARQAW